MFELCDLNNDTDMVHERLLFDIAAGMRWLREQRFERVVLLGNSGGGSLLGFYESQASRAPRREAPRAAGGEPSTSARRTCRRARCTSQWPRTWAKGASCSMSLTRASSTRRSVED